MSKQDCNLSVMMEDQQQQSVTDTPLVDQSTDSADDVAVSLPVTANDDSSQPAVMSAVSEQAVDMPVSQTASAVSSSQPIRVVPAVSSTGQLLGVSKGAAFVFCQVTSGGQTILVPRSVISGIQLSSGTAATSAASVTPIPVIRSVASVQTVLSDMPGVASGTSVSSSSSAAVVTQSSIRLLRPAVEGVRVIAGANSAANRATLGVLLNRGTSPQRLAVAIAPANNTLRPTGTGSIRLVAIRNSTPVAVGGVASSNSTVASPQLKLLTPAVSLSGVRQLTPMTAVVTTVTSSMPASASSGTASVVRQQTAVSDVQAYLRRIQELKSSQPDQGAKMPTTSAATVRTPLKAKTVLPSLTSTQQIVVLQSGSQPQLANISAAQLVCISVIICVLYNTVDVTECGSW